MANNDSDSTPADSTMPRSDAHGRAALLLVESLIHGLCESATLTTGAAADIAERAVEVQFDQVQEAGDDEKKGMERSHALLVNIAASLGTDNLGDPRSPPSLAP